MYTLVRIYPNLRILLWTMPITQWSIEPTGDEMNAGAAQD